ncbi:MAG: hydrogenase [Candidatus Hydrogenedentes bacterium]|nr:hydrogenase [Candidatus Hydrogenedentota bacterium]
MISTLVDSLLMVAVLLDLAMLGTSRLSGCIRLFASQSVVLSVLPVLLELHNSGNVGAHAAAIALGAIGLKGILIPWILLRILRSGEIHREIQPFLGFTSSVLFGAVIVIASFGLSHRLTLPVAPAADLILPVAISTVLIGMVILVSRLKALTQVIGYLVVENGVFILGLLLLEQLPILVELGILLDLFVAVFIMGIVVYHIRQEFDHMDTHLLDTLKES